MHVCQISHIPPYVQYFLIKWLFNDFHTPIIYQIQYLLHCILHLVYKYQPHTNCSDVYKFYTVAWKSWFASDEALPKKGLCLYKAFLYNSCIPDLSYTTLYTVVCKKKTFLWLSYTNHIPKPVVTKLYTAIGFFYWWIPNTYQSLWHIPGLYHSSKILIYLRWHE